MDPGLEGSAGEGGEWRIGSKGIGGIGRNRDNGGERGRGRKRVRREKVKKEVRGERLRE